MKNFTPSKGYIFILLIILILGITIYNIMENRSLDVKYSTYNTKNYGTKVLYFLSEKMGYKVERFKQPAMFLADNYLCIIIKPNVGFYNDKEQKYLRSWVEKGNTLMIADDSKVLFDSFLFNNSDSKKYSKYFEFKLKKGRIIVVIDANTLVNKSIFTKKQNGIDFIEILDGINKDKILFNEFYHGFGKKEVNLIDILYDWQLVIFVQILLAGLIFLLIKAQRFGRSLNLTENEKKIENENIYALANILNKSRVYIIILSVYTKILMDDLKRFFAFEDENEIIDNLAFDYCINGINLPNLLLDIERIRKREIKKSTKIFDTIRDIEKIRKELNNDF